MKSFVVVEIYVCSYWELFTFCCVVDGCDFGLWKMCCGRWPRLANELSACCRCATDGWKSHPFLLDIIEFWMLIPCPGHSFQFPLMVAGPFNIAHFERSPQCVSVCISVSQVLNSSNMTGTIYVNIFLIQFSALTPFWKRPSVVNSLCRRCIPKNCCCCLRINCNSKLFET